MKKYCNLILGLCLMFSCSKSSVEQEQDLCKDAKSVPQITFVKLSNTYSLHKGLLSTYKQDSIAITFKYQDAEADIGTGVGTGFPQQIPNADGINQSVFIDLYKKNTDGTFTKLILTESLNYIIFPVPTQGGITIGGSNSPILIKSISSCNGEITCSYIFEFTILKNFKLALNDKIKFSIILKDRATHYSNVIETTETTLSENP